MKRLALLTAILLTTPQCGDDSPAHSQDKDTGKQEPDSSMSLDVLPVLPDAGFLVEAGAGGMGAADSGGASFSLDAGHHDAGHAPVRVDGGNQDAQVLDSGTGEPICLEPGEDCSTMNDGCCNGSMCVSDVGSTDGVCAAICNSNNQCVSGCCATLTSGLASVCSPPEYCPIVCSPANELCGNNAPGNVCCEDTRCVIDTDGVNRCAAKCTSSEQCVSGCCSPLTDGQLVCGDPAFCE